MENISATDLLVQNEKLAFFLDLYGISCATIQGTKRWRAGATARSVGKSYYYDGSSPEEALAGLKNQLTTGARQKLSSMSLQMQDIQEIIRFG